MASFPVVVTASGAQPTPPAVLLARLIAAVEAVRPGFTANLPASMIEDLTSTGVAFLSQVDQDQVEAVNSLTPLGTNAFLLNQLGQIYGVPLGLATNTSVNVVFSGPPSQVIAKGFTVSDGTNQYFAVDGGVIGQDGQSVPLFCLAPGPGTGVVPANTVTNLITAPPPGVTITAVNPLPGTPGGAPETQESYQARVLQAGLAASQGMPRYLKTLLGNVSGVQSRLISVRQVSGSWEVIVGGGDPYQVAYAIFQALFDLVDLTGSTLSVTAITKANPGVVTTDLNHGYASGQVVTINGIVGMTELNGVPLTATVLDEKRFSVGQNTTAFNAWVSGGMVTPNLRNVEVTLADYPDTYDIPFVNPPQQTVAVTMLWNTTAVNFVSEAAVSQLASPAIVAYINSIAVGLPINQLALETVFQAAVASILPPQLLTRLVPSVSINGVGVVPVAGTFIIAGDPESYFQTDSTQITVLRG